MDIDRVMALHHRGHMSLVRVKTTIPLLSRSTHGQTRKLRHEHNILQYNAMQYNTIQYMTSETNEQEVVCDWVKRGDIGK